MRDRLRKECRRRHNRREGIVSMTVAQSERSHDCVVASDRPVDECGVERIAAKDINAPFGNNGARAPSHERRDLVPSLDGEPYEPLPGRAAGTEYDQFHRPFYAHDWV